MKQCTRPRHLEHIVKQSLDAGQVGLLSNHALLGRCLGRLVGQVLYTLALVHLLQLLVLFFARCFVTTVSREEADAE
jgi:hypothetical protein